MKGVNDNGELVGEYLTTELHGFYNYGTTFLNPEPANLRFSGVWSIYNHGTIVVAGTHNSTRHYNGYHSDSPFSSFNPVDVAGSAFTDLFDINDAGIMVGGYSVSGSYTAFVYDRALGTFSAVRMPGAAQTTAIGINNSNHVAGSYTDGSGARHGYLFDDTGYTSIDVPGTTLTEALGLNDLGQVVGYYRDSSANNHGYIFDVFTREFTYIDIPAPGAYGTRVYDINNNGLLVGGYLDSSNFHYGFTATIVPVPAALLLFGSGLAGLFGMATLRRGRARRA